MADYVEIKVTRALYAYIVHTTGSDIIHLSKSGVLWSVIKRYLICYTQWKTEAESGLKSRDLPVIKIELLRKNGIKVPNKDITLNTDCRRYLSLEGNRVVVRLLIQEFQKTFLDYMKGALMANPKLNIKETINIFCDDYGLEFTSSYEMLKKRWYRHRQKEICNQNTLLNL